MSAPWSVFGCHALCVYCTGMIMCMAATNERWHYKVMSSPSGWAHSKNDPCSITLDSFGASLFQSCQVYHYPWKTGSFWKKNVTLVSDFVCYKPTTHIFLCSGCNTINTWSAPWILLVRCWYFSTRASAVTVLIMHPCISRCLWVNDVCLFHFQGIITHQNLNKMADILQGTISNTFSWVKVIAFESNFTEGWFPGVNSQYVRIGSSCGFSLNRLWAISCSNIDTVHWCHMMHVGHSVSRNTCNWLTSWTRNYMISEHE